ncbi:Carrier protein YMC2 [Balamuthia mandrillaris]
MAEADSASTGHGGPAAALKDILSGTVAGMAQVAAGHPLDTAKVRLQSQVVGAGQQPHFNGMMDTLTKTWQAEGIRGLYKGASSPLAGAMAHNAAVFFSYGRAKEFVAPRNGKLEGRHYYQAGAITGLAVTIVEGPVDLFKSKLQAQVAAVAQDKSLKPNEVRYTGAFHCARHIASTYGVKGVYQGLAATVLRNVPAFGSYFAAFELTKRGLTPPDQKLPSLSACFVAGGAAGFAFWGVFFPLDTIKTRMQTDACDVAHRRYTGVLDCAAQVWREGGLRAFYKGYTPAVIRAVCVNAAIFFAFEASKRALG